MNVYEYINTNSIMHRKNEKCFVGEYPRICFLLIISILLVFIALIVPLLHCIGRCYKLPPKIEYSTAELYTVGYDSVLGSVRCGVWYGVRIGV